MKNFKHIFVAVLFIIILSWRSYYFTFDDTVMISTNILIIVFFLFNLLIRKKLLFKNYLINQYNPLTAKINREYIFDILKGLMFEKIIDVINNSDFNLVEVNKEKFEILATTKFTFKSWGENLYINFEDIENESLMTVNSVTLFQIYSSGKNESNHHYLLNEIENSLIV
ncbi:hypothetical protein [Aquimarina agarilytica]|uniref:hypothetical protein n=1 Tax=Aquimarina agarilytica TaxID=1087449 RepID=UPI0002897522|nr:hypothetical protein [Aquimarina agarilytica]